MNSVIIRFKRISSTLWSHKKKTIFAVGVLSYGVNYLQLYNRYDF